MIVSICCDGSTRERISLHRSIVRSRGLASSRDMLAMYRGSIVQGEQSSFEGVGL